MQSQLAAFLSSEQYAATRLWNDRILSDALLISHRAVDSTPETFDDLAHTHDFCELVVYLGGAVEYLAEHSLFAPRFGDIFCAPPGQLHGAHLLAPSRYDRYVLWFPADLLDAIDGGRDALAAFASPPTQGNLLRPDAREVPGLLALLREAETEGELVAWSAILRFFARFGALWSDRTPAAITPLSLPQPLEAALGIIAADYATIRSVADIADRVHVSSEHLSRLFSHQFGIPISAYLRRHRLGESKRLLLEGGSVTEVCYAVGFANVSHFIRCFRAHVGMTPAKYRELG